MKLQRVTRIDSIPAESTYFNEQGFLHDAPIVTSTGIFEYALPDGGIRRELRLPEHVFDKESLSSYAGKPVIITHDAGSIDKTNVMNEIVGTILSEGYKDGNDVRCKIVIHDIDKVKKTPYRELSLGYSLDLIEEPGEWNGEHYDAIQTNIRINHLAIVEAARAGEQAHLNLDGKKVELDDKSIPKEGGNVEMDKNAENAIHGDSIDMTPEELIEAIKSYKASKPEANTAPATEPKVEDGDNVGAKGKVSDEPAEQPAEPTAPVAEEQPAPEEPVAQAEVEKKDGDISALLSTLEELLNTLKANCEAPKPVEADSTDNADNTDNSDGGAPVVGDDNADNDDSSDDKSQSMNNDSADEVFRQRLSICRIGDKLHMDGLENKSILDGKKAIINKVLPTMRLDGKSKDYIDAAYDLAVGEVEKHKGVEYQRQQMSANATQRADSTDNASMAVSARKRMLEREGGNE